MNDGKVAWRGNFPAVVTPFTRDGAIDEKRFVEAVELLASEGAHGVVVSGSNGESWALKGPERLSLFALARRALPRDITVIGGTGSIPTGDVVELTKAARETGVDGVMIMPPYYCGASRREVVAHFRTISDEARLPILVYNSPKSTGVDVVADFAAELAEIEWVCGIKQSTLDFTVFEQTVAACGERIRVFTGHSAKRGMASVLAGAVGFVSSLDPHVMGREGISLFALTQSGQFDAARRVQMRTLALDRGLGGIASGPAVMKAAMNMLNRPGGYPRRPLLEASDGEKEAIRHVLDSLGLFSQVRAAA
ncbi:dihydrodipicolinate synthase family protein [Elioraea sp.]|uniref:dihydrodipicolinate synthase family protein n=1 Tax=Elioraea sp. TaxID=2185103 RepID=UPI003F710B0E